MCLNAAEDIKHMFFTCDRAKAVWRALGVWDDIAELLCVDRSGSVILEEMIRKANRVRSMDVGMAIDFNRKLVYMVGLTTAHAW